MMTRNDAIAILNIMKIRTGIGTDDLDTTIRMEKEREAIDFAVDDMRALRALSVGWISVKDKLPDASETGTIAALAYIANGKIAGEYYEDMCLVLYYYNGAGWATISDDIVPDGIVTHWMPLPDSPKGGTTND